MIAELARSQIDGHPLQADIRFPFRLGAPGRYEIFARVVSSNENPWDNGEELRTVTDSPTRVLHFSAHKPNAVPVAVNDHREVSTSQPTLLDVLANDSDPNGDPLILSLC